MSSARSDLFIIIGVALATTIGLFVLHKWYGTFIDMRFHAQLSEAGTTEALLAAHEEEQNLLNAGKVPLKDAMAKVAQSGRPASVAPAPSEDISAVSGWIYQRGFKPATAHPVRAAAAPKPVETVPAEAPAAEPAQPPAAVPAGKPLQLRTGVVQPAVK